MAIRPFSTSLLKAITGILVFFVFLTLLIYLVYPRIVVTESPEPGRSPEKSLNAENILDTVTFVSSQEKRRSDLIRGKEDNGCLWGEGQSLWIIIRDKVNDKSEFAGIVKKKLSASDYNVFKEDSSDGVLFFFYGLGGSKEIWKNNVFKLLRAKILSNILPWQKRIDMIFLPTPGPLNTGSLDFVLNNKPTLPVFTPPEPPPMPWLNYLITIPGGYKKLTDRVSSLCLPMEAGGGEEGYYEMELIINVGDGIAILSGAGKAGFFNIIETAAKKTNRPVYYYLGGTGILTGMKNSNILNRLEDLKKHCPHLKIYSNYSTSVMAEEMLQQVFGNDYKAVSPGEQVQLIPPYGKD
ncbi:MAG: hypothetical protein M1269_01045 [Chloroflexi bacterium]|nr:hypothetical protein [Chloroflexota bacterium]